MTEELSDAILDYVASQYGGAFPGNVRGYLTNVAVTQEYNGEATLDMTMQLIAMPTPRRKHAASPWVAVKSRLPDVDEPVLVCVGDAVAIGACDDDEMFVRTDSLAVFWPQPTHWQPLPAGTA